MAGGRSSGLTYRADIDGLRAVAVLAVVVFHAFTDVLPGGFFGVDVFFVISGYLISTIIFDGLQAGRFSIRDFYARRARRILPALVVVLTVSLAFGWLILLPAEYRDLGKHTAGSAAFVANFVVKTEAGYFFEADRTPLLHLWSLGVEEQFYLVWPWLVVLAWRRRWLLIVLVAGGLVASFALSVHLTYTNRVEAFFSPLTRAWQLLLGSVLAFVMTRRSSTPSSARATSASNLAAIFGVLFVLGPLVHVTGERAVPGWWAVGPTLGAVLVIAAGPSAWINRTVLASAPMVAIGLVSYPLYLWHWPVLSFAHIVQNPPSVGARGVAILASGALAWLTVRWIERPIRFRIISPVIPVVLGVALSLTGATGLVAYTGRIQPRAARFGLTRFLSAGAEPAGGPSAEAKRTEHHGLAFWTLGDASAPAVLYVGDSKMNHYWPRIERLIAEGGNDALSAVFATCPGAPPIPRVRAYVPDRCGGLAEAALDFAHARPVSTVVIGAAWNNDFLGGYYFEDGQSKLPLSVDTEGSTRAFAELERMLRDLNGSGKTTYLILDSPSGRWLHPGNIVRRSLAGFTIDRRGVSRAELLSRFGPLRERLLAVAARSGARVIDPFDSLCEGDVCPSVTLDGLPIYLDTGHLRPSFVREHASFIDVTLAPEVVSPRAGGGAGR